MRSEKEFFKLILDFASNDQRIRLVGMEGSRTNVNVIKDEYQDYDISFLVTDYNSFLENDKWLDIFGKRIILQKPEAMELFPPELDWFSYLMIFEDGVKLDLSVIPLNKIEQYLKSDKLLKILLDKDNLIKHEIIPTDEDFWISKPSSKFVDDCCCEFWFVTTYICKGMLRDEILYVSFLMEKIMREQIFNMLTWKVGIDYGFNFSVGKYNKYIKKYLSVAEWKLLMETYCLDSLNNCLIAFESSLKLFRQTTKYVVDKLGYQYPNYDDCIFEYLEKQKMLIKTKIIDAQINVN